MDNIFHVNDASILSHASKLDYDAMIKEMFKTIFLVKYLKRRSKFIFQDHSNEQGIAVVSTRSTGTVYEIYCSTVEKTTVDKGESTIRSSLHYIAQESAEENQIKEQWLNTKASRI